MDLDDLKAEVYRRESSLEEKEAAMMSKKNKRRRDKILGASPAQDGEAGEAGGSEPRSNPASQASSAAPVKLAVIGGGPAGATAAIYAARAGLRPLVVAPPIGGQLMSKGVSVENYPGIFEASGGDIIKLMKRQAMRFSATFEDEEVVSVDLSSRPFVVTTNSSAFRAQTLVVATGADSRWLGVPGEEDLKGGGVSSCATCDGFLFSGKPRRHLRPPPSPPPFALALLAFPTPNPPRLPPASRRQAGGGGGRR